MKLTNFFALLLFAILAMPVSITAKEEIDPEVLADMKTDVSKPDNIIDYVMETYKTVGKKKLIVRVYTPDEKKFKGVRPAVVIYHGGGWKGGSPDTFIPQARYFRDRGIKVFVATYRLAKGGNTPATCLMDAKSAMRYVRANAKRFNIDPNRIAASGGSAGAHLSAAIATTTKFNDKGDDMSVSCVPNALVLFSPVINNGPVNGWAYDRVKDIYKDFSPYHNIKKGMCPTISFLGSKDPLISEATLREFTDMILATGAKGVMHVYDGKGHGFFKSEPEFSDTMVKATAFLEECGFMKSKKK